MQSFLRNKWLKVCVFVVCLFPLASLLWKGLRGGLGANPVEFITHATGDWTIRFLVITLAITPLRQALHLPDLIRFRRMFGLYAFFFACLHFTTYIWLDKFFDFSEIWKDIAKRPFITIGFAAFVLMIPLALTSTAGWIRRLGGKRWQTLHRLIYGSAICAAIHYYWLVKSDVRKPLFYAGCFALLLLWRIAHWFRHRRLPVSVPIPAPTKT